MKPLVKWLIITVSAIYVVSAMNYNNNFYYRGTKSDHYDDTRFFDPEIPDNKTFFSLLKWQFTRNSPKWPDKVPNEQYDIPPKRVEGNKLRVSNVGHVTFLLQTQGLNILTDPVWSERASPVSFLGPKRVIEPGIKFEDLPPIDVIWVSHNHYDHLDLETIGKLWQKFKPRIIVPLGNDRIIRSYNKEIIVEAYDWGEKVEITPNITFHIEPMQHWSARGLLDHNKALWAAVVMKTPGGNIYFVGDSGYGNGRYFKRVREKYGDIRLALLPIGAYEPRWFMGYSHMSPTEFLQSHFDLGIPYTIPSHYDVFKLADDQYGQALNDLQTARANAHPTDKIKVMKVGEYWFVPEK